jgi:Zn-dependent peptidase ImmA (M78 family)
LAFAVTRLPVGEGWYLPDVPGIVLDDRLDRVQRRCVLAHELAHVDLDHHQVAGNGPGTDRLARRNERAADVLAAKRLLSVAQLAFALPAASGQAEVAELLEVTPHLLEVRLQHLEPSERHRLAALFAQASAA